MKKVTTLALTLLTLAATAQAQDTTKIIMGDKTIIIIGEDIDDEEVNLDDLLDSLDAESEEWDWHNDEDKEIAHWGGFEMGVNGLMNADNGFDLEDNLYDLDYSRSFVFNLNLLEKKIPFFNGYGGLVTGLGFSFHNYQFKGGTNLYADNDSTWVVNDTVLSYDKNKLKMGFIKVPLLLEFNTSLNSKKSFHFAAGVEAGFKLSSKTKQKYEFQDEKYKIKTKGHYNLNPWRLNAVARIGYRNITLFANYGLTPLFEDGKGPEMYPFEVGISIIGF